MPLRSCRVSVTDSRGVVHAVDVIAETLFEAVAAALGIPKRDGRTDPIGPATRLEMEVREPVTKHGNADAA